MIDAFDRRQLLETLASGLVFGSAASSSAGPGGEIPTRISFTEDGRLDRQPFGDLRVFLEGPTEQLKSLTVGSLELKPGQQPHPPHTHPEEEVMLITDGHGEISLGGKTTRVAPGTIMYAGSNRLHGIVNTSDKPLTFYFFKWIGK